MSLASKTKDIINHFEFKFNKNFGQNFLIDELILNRIVESSDIDSETHVIEIGPGIGTLTQEMAKKAGHITAIEIDPSLVEILKETLSNYNNIEIIQGDALKANFNEIIKDSTYKKFKVVANLPYYMTTPMITKILNEWKGIESITLMIQKEAGDRVMAKADEEEYGTLALTANYYSTVNRICKAAPVCFMPQPRVESVVLRMDIYKEPPYYVSDEKLLFNIIKGAFNMRRKTLWNVLKGYGLPKEELKVVFEEAGIDEKRRGETLSLKEFADLTNSLKTYLK